MSANTTRLGLTYPQTTDVPLIAQDIEALAEQLDAVIGGDYSGTAANRSSVVTAPVLGMRYYATDTGAWTMYNGSSWIAIGVINTSAGNIQAVAAAASAGSTGLAADAGHVHPQEAASTLAALVGNILMPIGHIYHSGGTSPITSSSALATALGFGTWAAYAPGQGLIGVGTHSDGVTSKTIASNTAYGEYLHTLSKTESGIPDTDVPFILGTTTANSFDGTALQGTSGAVGGPADYNALPPIVGAAASQGHNNIHPVLGTYMYIRTA